MLSPRLFQLLWAAATLVVAAFILYASSDPSGPVFGLNSTESYFGHYFANAAMAFCAMTAVMSRSLRALLLIVLAALVFAVSLEFYQAVLPRRSASAYDALSGLSGAMSGALLAFAMIPVWAVTGALSGDKGPDATPP